MKRSFYIAFVLVMVAMTAIADIPYNIVINTSDNTGVITKDMAIAIACEEYLNNPYGITRINGATYQYNFVNDSPYFLGRKEYLWVDVSIVQHPIYIDINNEIKEAWLVSFVAFPESVTISFTIDANTGQIIDRFDYYNQTSGYKTVWSDIIGIPYDFWSVEQKAIFQQLFCLDNLGFEFVISEGDEIAQSDAYTIAKRACFNEGIVESTDDNELVAGYTLIKTSDRKYWHIAITYKKYVPQYHGHQNYCYMILCYVDIDAYTGEVIEVQDGVFIDYRNFT